MADSDSSKFISVKLTKNMDYKQVPWTMRTTKGIHGDKKHLIK